MIDKSHAVGANSKIAKSALALLKIHQLIEVGYGGNITNEEWSSLKEVYSIEYDVIENEMIISKSNPMRLYSHVSFHTEKQAEEFMSYPENIQLLKDYYMMS